MFTALFNSLLKSFNMTSTVVRDEESYALEAESAAVDARIAARLAR